MADLKAEKSTTTLSKKLISLKTFNTFPSTKSKESKESKDASKAKKKEATTASLESSKIVESAADCLVGKKSSLFSTTRFTNGKSDRLRCFISKSADSKSSCDYDNLTSSSNQFSTTNQKSINKSANSKATNKSSTNKYTSFFTSSITSTTKSPNVLVNATATESSSTQPVQATALTTVSRVSSNSPTKSINSSKTKTKTSNPGFNSLPRFKFSKKKSFGNADTAQQWHADCQLSSNSVLINNNKPAKLKDKSSLKSSSHALRSKTAKTINSFVKPIKRSSMKFENKKHLFTSSTVKPKIIEELSSVDADLSPPEKGDRLDDPGAVQPEITTTGLKVSFDEDVKIDRHRSNSDNARLGKKQNLISSLRKSIFANQELTATSCPANDRSLSLTNKSLSNRMMGMISKGRNHLAIVRSHSLESNKFSAKRVGRILIY